MCSNESLRQAMNAYSRGKPAHFVSFDEDLLSSSLSICAGQPKVLSSKALSSSFFVSTKHRCSSCQAKVVWKQVAEFMTIFFAKWLWWLFCLFVLNYSFGCLQVTMTRA